MNDSENEKSFDELADEALDAVAGGKSVFIEDTGPWECDICGDLLFEGGFQWWQGKRICQRHKMSSY